MEDREISSIADHYIERYSNPEPLVSAPVPSDLGISVVIPSYKEPDIVPSLHSLLNCSLPPCSVEIIVVINAATGAKEEDIKTNQRTKAQITAIQSEHNKHPVRIHTIDITLPKKHAGVGLARKTGMDEAYKRFLKIGRQAYGVIACFDADTTCEKNYLIELYRHFQSNTEACSIHYEHNLDQVPRDHKQAIINYELHLRYYIEALRYSGHPHAYQTIGSSMAVRASAYAAEGGMNRKKAGEDFYFLLKYIQKGTLSELKTTTIYPSARVSDRVPFGTGRAMQEFETGSSRYDYSFNPQSFEDIKQFIHMCMACYETKNPREVYEQFSPGIQSFIAREEFETAILSATKQSKTPETFSNRFFRWFNLFTAMKLVHHLRDNSYPNEPILECCQKLLASDATEPLQSEEKFLLFLRRK